MRNPEQELDALFRAYSESFADVDASSAFMPGLWEKIDARRSFAFRVSHLARAFLGASAVAFTLMAGFLVLQDRTLPDRTSPDMPATYLDALASAHSSDSMLDAMHSETFEANQR